MKRALPIIAAIAGASILLANFFSPVRAEEDIPRDDWGPKGPKLTVVARINNRPVECVIDTGVGHTVINRATADAVQITNEQPYWRWITSAFTGGRMELKPYVARVQLFDMAWDNVHVLVVTRGELTGGSCWMGTDVLARQPIVIDWRKREVRKG